MDKSEFYAKHIGDRTKEQLAAELHGIYLVLRANCPQITEENPDDPWLSTLHLADVLDKHILRKDWR